MKIRFTKSFEDLRTLLAPLDGEWTVTEGPKKVLKKGSGVLNWYESTGTVQLQGKDPDKSTLLKSALQLIEGTEPPKDNKTEEAARSKSQQEITTDNKDPAVAVSDESKAIAIEDGGRPEPARDFLRDSSISSELFIATVSAVGTEYRWVIECLEDRLRQFSYEPIVVKISELLPQPPANCSEFDRISHLMKEGDKLRKCSSNNSILAAGASDLVRKKRRLKPKTSKIAFILTSLKHPDEVDFLRKVYGQGFYLLGIHADAKRRFNYLTEEKGLSQAQADNLIEIDEDEKVPHGQRTRDTFHKSDLFLALGDSSSKMKSQLSRFLGLLFSNPHEHPTFDEWAMFMAFNSSVRSSDLSRQVGAVITSKEQLIATGANDCPQAGGGQYFTRIDTADGKAADDPDGKDYTRGVDSNKAVQLEIIYEIMQKLNDQNLVTDRSKAQEILLNSKIGDLTEFGRVVHAEMEALLSCARAGIPTVGASLYCTTYPCHNCAKHVVDAGIKDVVYVEPYPKSRALELHSDSIRLSTDPDADSEIDKDSKEASLVTFRPFTGVAARRFLDLFSMNLGNGNRIKRKDSSGNAVEWDIASGKLRTPLVASSYLDLESEAGNIWSESLAGSGDSIDE